MICFTLINRDVLTLIYKEGYIQIPCRWKMNARLVCVNVASFSSLDSNKR